MKKQNNIDFPNDKLPASTNTLLRPTRNIFILTMLVYDN